MPQPQVVGDQGGNHQGGTQDFGLAQDRPFGCTNLRSAFDQIRALERNGYGRKGEYVCFDVHPFRTTRPEHWLKHLGNSRDTFLRLLDKARSFPEAKAQALIDDLNRGVIFDWVPGINNAGLSVRNPRTGNVVRFMIVNRRRDDGDTQYWDLVPVHQDQVAFNIADVTMRVYND